MEIPLFFYKAFENMNRLAPGSDETTLKVLDKITPDDKITILDIGCGVGADTIILANYFENATVEAIDLFKHYLAVLDEKIIKNNLENRVFTYEMTMYDLDFANEDFDIVFSHASAHIMGFKKALNEWKRLIKPGGYLIVSDVSWIQKASKESKDFWKNTYDEIDTIENKKEIIRNQGYELTDYIAVSKDEWIDYYNQLEKNLNSLKSDKSAKEFREQLKKEINVFKNNSDDYTYVFYIMRKLE